MSSRFERFVGHDILAIGLLVGGIAVLASLFKREKNNKPENKKKA